MSSLARHVLTRDPRRAVPADLLALALFVTVGLFNHQGGLSLTGYARDLLPIGAAWFAAGAVFGLYRQPRWRTLLATWATGVTAGIAIRQAIVWHLHGDDAAFLAIALSFILLFVVAARALVGLVPERAS
mgnify:CR=1 FL=1